MRAFLRSLFPADSYRYATRKPLTLCWARGNLQSIHTVKRHANLWNNNLNNRRCLSTSGCPVNFPIMQSRRQSGGAGKGSTPKKGIPNNTNYAAHMIVMWYSIYVCVDFWHQLIVALYLVSYLPYRHQLVAALPAWKCHARPYIPELLACLPGIA